MLMPKRSAGIVVYRLAKDSPEVLLVHPGGPFWARKDNGAWSIPKGEYAGDERPLLAAKREFHEETNIPVPDGEYAQLSDVKLSGGKIVSAWAVEADVAIDVFKSNMFSIEWPPKSGHMQDFPEVDKIHWFSLDEARRKINKGQLPLLEELAQKLGTVAEGSAQTSLF